MKRSVIRELAFKLIYSLEIQKANELEEQIDLFLECNELEDEQAKEILAEFYYSEGNFQKAEEYGKVIEEKQENYKGLIDRIMEFFSKDK